MYSRIRNAWCSFRKYTLELYDRPSAPLELKIRMLRAEVLETMHGCVTWSPRACHYDTLRRAHHRFSTQSRRPPDFLSGHACQDGKGEHRGDFTQKADLICGIRGAHGGYETAEVRDVRRDGEGRGLLCGGPGKRVDGVFPGRPQSFRHQRRPMDDCSPGRGGIAQNGRTRGGTFHGKMDRCRKNQGWTTA